MRRCEWLIRVLIALGILVLMALVIVLPTVPAYAVELPAVTTDPAQPCGLTAEEYDLLLEDTELQGIGRQLAAGEKIYKVNGIFAASIIALETGWGTSYNYRSRNNAAGNRGASGYMSFYNKQIGILYAIKNFDNLYIQQGLTTLEAIAPKYCPDNPEYWSAQVQGIMKKLIENSTACTG